MFRIVLWSLVASLVIVFAHVSDIYAGPILVSKHSVDQSTRTRVKVKGIPGETVDVDWKDSRGNAHSGRIILDVTGNGSIDADAATGTVIKVVNVTQPGITASVVAAAQFDPSVNTVVTSLALDPGSTATVGGQTFSLGGEFITVATGVDYDSNSSTFGHFDGFIPVTGFDVNGQSTAGTLLFELPLQRYLI